MKIFTNSTLVFFNEKCFCWFTQCLISQRKTREHVKWRELDETLTRSYDNRPFRAVDVVVSEEVDESRHREESWRWEIKLEIQDLDTSYLGIVVSGRREFSCRTCLIIDEGCKNICNLKVDEFASIPVHLCKAWLYAPQWVPTPTPYARNFRKAWIVCVKKVFTPF